MKNSKKKIFLNIPKGREYARSLFLVATVWYVIALTIETVLPGFFSIHIDLDLFLWCVIVIATIYFVIDYFSS